MPPIFEAWFAANCRSGLPHLLEMALRDDSAMT